ncbi:MAG: alpha/beta hydrolase [Deltaproteobacteria bacterium]|nr:alpha/beta hydrolase [Deltaproteobacteria bacterium]
MHWLLLRGLVREIRHWGNLPELFEKTVPGAKTHMLDLPGIGTEIGRVTPATVDGIMEDLRARWLPLRGQDSDGSGEWGIFGVSLGAMVALSWAARHPEDFKRMVIINTSARGLSSATERFRPANLKHFPQLFVREDRYEREKTILSLTTSSYSDAPEKLDAVAQRQAEFAPVTSKFRQTGLRQLGAGLMFRVDESLRKNHPPCLALVSEKDTLVNPVCTVRLAEFLGATVRRHPWGNHDLPQDDAPWIVERIREWLQKVAAN